MTISATWPSPKQTTTTTKKKRVSSLIDYVPVWPALLKGRLQKIFFYKRLIFMLL